MTTRPSVTEYLASLKDGQWHPSKTLQTRRTVINRYGHPYSRLVYVGVIFRHDPVLGKPVLDSCPHHHYKQSAAAECARLGASRANKELSKS